MLDTLSISAFRVSAYIEYVTLEITPSQNMNYYSIFIACVSTVTCYIRSGMEFSMCRTTTVLKKPQISKHLAFYISDAQPVRQFSSGYIYKEALLELVMNTRFIQLPFKLFY